MSPRVRIPGGLLLAAASLLALTSEAMPQTRSEKAPNEGARQDRPMRPELPPERSYAEADYAERFEKDLPKAIRLYEQVLVNQIADRSSWGLLQRSRMRLSYAILELGDFEQLLAHLRFLQEHQAKMLSRRGRNRKGPNLQKKIRDLESFRGKWKDEVRPRIQKALAQLEEVPALEAEQGRKKVLALLPKEQDLLKLLMLPLNRRPAGVPADDHMERLLRNKVCLKAAREKLRASDRPGREEEIRRLDGKIRAIEDEEKRNYPDAQRKGWGRGRSSKRRDLGSRLRRAKGKAREEGRREDLRKLEEFEKEFAELRRTGDRQGLMRLFRQMRREFPELGRR